MKNTPLQSILEDSLGHMFVSDKSGKRMFFPWGDKKPGYLIKSKNLEVKIRTYYKRSFFVCLALFVIGASIFQGFWGIIGSLFVCFGGLYFVQQFYLSRIVKSLPIAKAKYKDVVLEKYEPDDTEESDLQNP